MNKKLLTYFLLLFLAVTMPSCSNDNDNDEPESSVEDLIVGVWKEEFDDGSYSMLTFNNDGTYAYTIQEKYAEQEGYNTYKEYGTYVIQKSSAYRDKYILTLINSDNNDPEALQIVSISKNKLVLRYEGSSEGESTENETYEYTRVE